MKNSINTILLVIIIILLGCLIWITTKNKSITQDDSSEKIAAAVKIIQEKHGGNSFPLMKCTYKGQTVIQLDTRPVDGPVTIFDLNGSEIGSAGSGFGGPVQSSIDFSQVKDCSNI